MTRRFVADSEELADRNVRHRPSSGTASSSEHSGLAPVRFHRHRDRLGAAEAVDGQRAPQYSLDSGRIQAVLACQRIDGVPDEEVEQNVQRIGLPPSKVDQMQMGGTMAMMAVRTSGVSTVPHGWRMTMPVPYDIEPLDAPHTK